MTKAELLIWLQVEHQKWQALLDQIGPTRMEEPGVNGDWSLKDMVAHLTGWNHRLVDRFEAAQRGEPEPAPAWSPELKSDDEVNAWMYESYHGRTLEQVLDETNQLFQRLVAVIEALPEPVRIEPENHMVWVGDKRFSASEFFDHYRDEHEADVRAWMARQEKP